MPDETTAEAIRPRPARSDDDEGETPNPGRPAPKKSLNPPLEGVTAERWDQEPPNSVRLSFRGRITSFGPNNFSGLVRFHEKRGEALLGVFRLRSTDSLLRFADTLRVNMEVEGDAYVNGLPVAEIVSMRPASSDK